MYERDEGFKSGLADKFVRKQIPPCRHSYIIYVYIYIAAATELARQNAKQWNFV